MTDARESVAGSGSAESAGDWAAAWRALVERPDVEVTKRLRQGHAFHRASRTGDLRVQPGRVSVRVQDARATPYTPELELTPLDDEAWITVIEVLAGKLRHSARLLAGQAPDGLDAELAGTGVRVFPRYEELATSCDCADRVWPCAHVAALWEAFEELLAEEPFALFKVRGRGRERLLAELAEARRQRSRGTARRALPLEELEATRWSRTAEPIEGFGVPPAEEPRTPAGPLKLLGDPPGWAGGVDAWNLFSPLVSAAAEWAASLEEAAASSSDDGTPRGTGYRAEAGSRPDS
ncbi:hypothetical protein ER308_05315 [Egibacter rhizosphaerae]|uniref:SWIM-type domain-containing protein n=1 Tax=Egibacter rhizosphaerae TaxID=1670831 RepID=A0A411YCU8_9ACTN|nr:hypothetical protein [Egibacter rhizosphaerae]QBI19020.1 hypothetical protein ER308_05315 [Egibacter rhizosphaerae]